LPRSLRKKVTLTTMKNNYLMVCMNNIDDDKNKTEITPGDKATGFIRLDPAGSENRTTQSIWKDNTTDKHSTDFRFIGKGNH